MIIKKFLKEKNNYMNKTKLRKAPEHSKLVFKGVLHEVWQWDQEMFDGTFKVFEMIKRKNTSTILAITEDKKIIVNFEEQPHRGSFVAIPGGVNEDGESELENAKRELVEETGYESEDWELWVEQDVLNHYKLEWYDYLYIARNCVKSSETKLDPGEKIITKLFSFEDFLEITQRENFRNIFLKKYVRNILGNNEELLNFKNFLFKK